MSTIYRKPTGFWYYNATVNGQRIRKALQTCSKRAAVQKQRYWDRRIAEEALNPHRPSPLLSAYVDQYLEYSQTNKAHETFLLDRQCLASFLAFAGDMPLDAVDAHLVERWKSQRSREASARTVNKQLRHLRAAFSSAAKWDMLRENPLVKVRPIREDEAVPYVMSHAEVARLLRHLRADVRVPVLIALYTGLLLGEVANLQWGDIDWTRRILCVLNRGTYHTKSRKVRPVAFNEVLEEELSVCRRESGLIWPHNADGLSKAFKSGVRLAGLPEAIHFHTLRHTFLSDRANAGVPLHILQKQAGHSNIGVTQGCIRLSEQGLHQAVNGVDYRSRAPDDTESS